MRENAAYYSCSEVQMEQKHSSTRCATDDCYWHKKLFYDALDHFKTLKLVTLVSKFWLPIGRRLVTISRKAPPTHPIQLGCTTRSTSSERQMSGPARSAGTCPPPVTRSNWPRCWTGRRPWLTCRTSVVDTIKVVSQHSNSTHFLYERLKAGGFQSLVKGDVHIKKQKAVSLNQ